jgi:hypothetical protein
VWWFWDSVGGDRKAAATPQVKAGDPFRIKPAPHCYCYHYFAYTDKNKENRINGFKQRSVN